MATTRLKTRIIHKIDTEARWKQNNPKLKLGEIGFTSDGDFKGWFKLGDGETPWTELKYAYSEFMANLINVDNLTIEMDKNGIISIKDTNVSKGTYSASYDEDNDAYNIPSFTVNSKGQLTEVRDQKVQIKRTMNVIPVTGEYIISSNYALIVGKSTPDTSCIVNVPSSMPIGTQVIIKNTDSKNVLTIVPMDTVKIDDCESNIILAPFEYITLISTSSTDWSIISESSRFDTTKLARLNLNSDIIVRTDSLGNLEENISLMSLEKEHIATI